MLGGQRYDFFAEPRLFASLYVWSGIWQAIGFSSIIYLSVLAGVDQELHEASIIDGANKLQRMWHIDIPGILPTVSILLILSTGGILSVGFEKVFLMQNSLNITASEVTSTYVTDAGVYPIVKPGNNIK